MIPIVIVSDSPEKTKKFADGVIRKEGIKSYYVFHIGPKAKEFSIDQIREIEKQVKYSAKDKQLYILYDFDTASYEAQNAFLKTLEEHQAEVQFVLEVKNQHRLTQTILSRALLKTLSKDSARQVSKEVERCLNILIEKHDLSSLADSVIEKRLNDDVPNELFREIIEFFRKRYSSDLYASQIVSRALIKRNQILSNNVSPRHALDELLIYIWKKYK